MLLRESAPAPQPKLQGKCWQNFEPVLLPSSALESRERRLRSAPRQFAVVTARDRFHLHHPAVPKLAAVISTALFQAFWRAVPARSQKLIHGPSAVARAHSARRSRARPQRARHPSRDSVDVVCRGTVAVFGPAYLLDGEKRVVFVCASCHQILEDQCFGRSPLKKAGSTPSVPAARPAVAVGAFDSVRKFSSGTCLQAVLLYRLRRCFRHPRVSALTSRKSLDDPRPRPDAPRRIAVRRRRPNESDTRARPVASLGRAIRSPSCCRREDRHAPTTIPDTLPIPTLHFSPPRPAQRGPGWSARSREFGQGLSPIARFPGGEVRHPGRAASTPREAPSSQSNFRSRRRPSTDTCSSYFTPLTETRLRLFLACSPCRADDYLFRISCGQNARPNATQTAGRETLTAPGSLIVGRLGTAKSANRRSERSAPSCRTTASPIARPRFRTDNAAPEESVRCSGCTVAAGFALYFGRSNSRQSSPRRHSRSNSRSPLEVLLCPHHRPDP